MLAEELAKKQQSCICARGELIYPHSTPVKITGQRTAARESR